MILNSVDDRKRWNDKHRERGHDRGGPASFLVELAPSLPAAPGRALDVACGAGANAAFLASLGYTVDALDWSPEALSRLRERPGSRSGSGSGAARLRPIACDVTHFPLGDARYDVVICFRFLDRAIWSRMVAALKPGGALVIETFTKRHLDAHPSFSPAYCLDDGELLRAFETSLLVARYVETTTAALLGFRRERP